MLILDEVYKTFQPGRGLGREMADWFKRLSGGAADAGGVQAVRGVNLQARPGEILGLVGESGSGKSTLGRIMAGLYLPDKGRVLFKGQDLAAMDKRGRREFRRHVQIMFQDPVSSLNPRFTAGATVEEGLIIHGLGKAAARKERVMALLEEVGLPPDSYGRYGHEFSGGQRQRLSLARALALDPEILIADEPVSALDVSIQAQIINLLMDLREKRGLTLILVSHDLPLVRVMADRLAVMYGGLLMEVVDKNILGQAQHHPYVQSLWASAEPRRGNSPPQAEGDSIIAIGGGGEKMILEGEPPDPANPPTGCPFHPRCREAEEICRQKQPDFKETGDGFFCACHLR